jgi:hypothetical protein
MAGELYEFDGWAEEIDGWDTDTGSPGIATFANALQTWSFMQNRPTTVAEAAMTFNVRPERIREAVEWSNWMFLQGQEADPLNQTIGHDGE